MIDEYNDVQYGLLPYMVNTHYIIHKMCLLNYKIKKLLYFTG